MKNILSLFLLISSFSCFSQTCEERETKLVRAVAGFSSGLLYNTYAVLGSVADAYEKGAYQSTMVEELMIAQKKLADNLVLMLDELVKNNILKAEADQTYALDAIDLLNGLKTQAGLLQEYARTSSGKKQEAYEEQRKKNWSLLSKMMGIKE